MKVKELVERLKAYDQELTVAVYCETFEDMDLPTGTRVETRDKHTQSYCKADHVLDFDTSIDEVLVIG